MSFNRPRLLSILTEMPAPAPGRSSHTSLRGKRDLRQTTEEIMEILFKPFRQKINFGNKIRVKRCFGVAKISLRPATLSPRSLKAANSGNTIRKYRLS